jgi:PKD repeat protein
MTRSPGARQVRVRSQQGFTLLETMLTVMLAGLILAPIFGWAFVASRQQAATVVRNIDGASVGLLRTYFLRDVASSRSALTGAAAAGTDCSGGGSMAADPGDTLLRLATSTGEHIVFNRAEASDGDGTSIWRRECSGTAATKETELIRDIAPASLQVGCSPRPGMPSTDCGRISLRVTTLSGQAAAMTASIRAGVSLGVVTGAGSGTPYLSPDVAVAVSPVDSETGQVRVYRGETVTFEATGSDPGGSELSYRWELGDGTTATTATVAHTYSSLGEFTAVVTVTNTAGTPASEFVRVQVVNRPPTAVISAPTSDPLTVNRCQAVSFAAVGSADNDSGGSIARYVWDYGDGETTTRTSASSHTHAFRAPRSAANPYSVTLRVEDNDHDAFGNGSATDTTKVVVGNRAPNTPTISGTWGSASASGGSTLSVTSPATVTFSATASDPDGSCDTLSYQWLVDGSPVSGATSATYSYSASGSKAVSVRVTDDQGSSKTSTAVTVATNRPPVVTFTMSSTSVRTGVDVTFTNTSTDPDGDAMTRSWTFPNGSPSSSTANSQVVKFGANTSGDTFVSGTYGVALQANDGKGGVITTTQNISVTGAPAPTGVGHTYTEVRGSCSFSLPFVGCVTYNWHDHNRVSWNAVSSVTEYQIHLRRSYGCGVLWLDTCYEDQYQSTTATTHNFVDQHQGKTWTVEVRAKDAYTGKWGAWSTSISAGFGG